MSQDWPSVSSIVPVLNIVVANNLMLFNSVKLTFWGKEYVNTLVCIPLSEAQM